MSNTKWAAIIYGRTYEVDFRLLSMPQNFESDDEKWAMKHISATMQSANKLPQHPRWSLFRNERFCIIGVTCMVEELIGSMTNELQTDYIRDFAGRTLYIFVGYVTQIYEEKLTPLSIPSYSSESLELFKPVYDHAKEKWYEKSHDPKHREPIRSEYEALQYISQDQDEPYKDQDELDTDLGNLNNDPEKAFIWPDEENFKQSLWQLASKSVEPTSLCFGLTSSRSYENSAFLNGTVPGLDAKIEIDKSKPKETIDKHNYQKPLDTSDIDFDNSRSQKSSSGFDLVSVLSSWLEDPKKITILGSGGVLVITMALALFRFGIGQSFLIGGAVTSVGIAFIQKMKESLDSDTLNDSKLQPTEDLLADYGVKFKQKVNKEEAQSNTQKESDPRQDNQANNPFENF
ncbi:MAG: hypothetical protein WBB43_06115 [Limnoraphis sp.]